MKLQNYALDKWIEGNGTGEELYDASNGNLIAIADSTGLDFSEMMHYARSVGNPNLRNMTFQQRGLMLKKLALYLNEQKESFYQISYKTGATRIDSWIDIEGGIGNLFSYASLRRQFPDQSYYVDGDAISLSKGNTFMGHHIMVPKEGVAIHINAFNFPVWGMLEKIAVNLLAGVPAIVKPASITSFLTEAVFKAIIKSQILPKGALQLICGSARTILDSVTNQDVVTFTGSASTGLMLKSHQQILSQSVPFNMEADSLNAIVLGSDVEPNTALFDIFIKEVRKEMIVKAGQKCTAVRRIIVPQKHVDVIANHLKEALLQVSIGDPRQDGVKMGPLAGKNQKLDVLSNIQKLSEKAEIILGLNENQSYLADSPTKGAFINPILLYNAKPFENISCHEIEAFGPIATIIPYQNLDEAISLSKMAKGSLCSTIVTDNEQIAKDYVINAATYHGRIMVLNTESAKESTGHGSPLPMLVHGGPGRAGGGEEMGGKRGVMHYLQRTAIQGSPQMMTKITGVFQKNAHYIKPDAHVFTKYFDELNIGDTVITRKRTITEADIVNFANLSWDHFYAHTDHTSLEGTIFEKPVAHGYFILSAAAGLFVNADKGPVLLNYGLDEFRFTKPVYAGTTIHVRLTVKEKTEQEPKNESDTPKGIVKFLVDVLDQTNETIAIGTILTMVAKKG